MYFVRGKCQDNTIRIVLYSSLLPSEMSTDASRPEFTAMISIAAVNHINILCRYELPIVFIVMNNNGIYSGLDKETWNSIQRTEDQLGLRYILLSICYVP